MFRRDSLICGLINQLSQRPSLSLSPSLLLSLPGSLSLSPSLPSIFPYSLSPTLFPSLTLSPFPDEAPWEWKQEARDAAEDPAGTGGLQGEDRPGIAGDGGGPPEAGGEPDPRPPQAGGGAGQVPGGGGGQQAEVGSRASHQIQIKLSIQTIESNFQIKPSNQTIESNIWFKLSNQTLKWNYLIKH